MPDPAPAERRRRIAQAFAVAGLALLVLALALYAVRRSLARDALTSWLRDRGVPAQAQVSRLGLSDVAASVRLGDPRNPDLTAEQIVVGYGLRGLSLEIREITLVRPTLRASVKGGRFSAGSLDPLIAELRKRPPKPGAPSPRIHVRGGVVQLATDYGPVRFAGNAEVAAGRLTSLAGGFAPATLQGKGLSAALGATPVQLAARADHIDLVADAPVTELKAGGVSVRDGRLRLTIGAPYPDLARISAAGDVAAHAELSAASLSVKGQALRNAVASFALTGAASGAGDGFAFAGRMVSDVRAAGGELAGGQASALTSQASFEDLRWSRAGGASANLAAALHAEGYRRQDLRLVGPRGAVRGPVRLTPQGIEAQLIASGLGRGAWTGLGAPARRDSAEIAAVKRAVQAFAFAAPAVAIAAAAADGVAVTLAQPVSVRPERGGLLTLAQRGSAYRLTAQGGGLPSAVADVQQVRLTDGGFAASGRVQGGLSIGPLQGAKADAAGVLRIRNGVTSFIASRCAPVAAARFELGANALTKLAGQLCPADAPLLTLGRGAWRVAARARAFSADAPFLQMRLRGAEGSLDMAERHGRLVLTVGEALDTAKTPRFHPVRVAGAADLKGQDWRGQVRVADAQRRPLARLQLTHDGASGRGGVTIDTGALVFAEGGLQPQALSPLAAALGSPVTGQAQFAGRFDWTPGGTSSGGVLETPGLAFQSPVGAVTGLSGRLVFPSLAPLTAAPGQRLSAQAVVTPLGRLEHPTVTIGLRGEALSVSGGEAGLGGGRVRLANLALPFSAGAPIRGEVELEGVQLHDLVESSPFGDRVELDARVSGRIPFQVLAGKLRVSEGSLHAVEPGRLSIQRAALSTVAASGQASAPGAPPPGADTFTDFAYQAMENLAFSKLEAGVNSQANGRLGVLFHIVGRHDPPKHQEIRLSVFDLLQRKFLNKRLPLPSGTGVDLTLDTTLNLDDLLADYGEFRRLHGSGPVQP